MSTGLFPLPPKLRLEVYTHLIKDSLARGDKTSIARWFFSCREVYEEMKSARISSIRPIFAAMGRWSAEKPETWAEHMCIAPLKIELPHDYDLLSLLLPPVSVFRSCPIGACAVCIPHPI
jgi:hypothetical protein